MFTSEEVALTFARIPYMMPWIETRAHSIRSPYLIIRWWGGRRGREMMMDSCLTPSPPSQPSSCLLMVDTSRSGFRRERKGKKQRNLFKAFSPTIATSRYSAGMVASQIPRGPLHHITYDILYPPARLAFRTARRAVGVRPKMQWQLCDPLTCLERKKTRARENLTCAIALGYLIM